MQKTDQNQSINPQSPILPTKSGPLKTIPIIPIKSEYHFSDQPQVSTIVFPTYEHNNQQKIIPGYNFQSLFRKKSHIRLARKKNKEESQKRNSNIKQQNSEKEAKNIQKGHWTNQENKLYHWFLELHNRHFILKYLRRTDKIFKSMASFINTREAEQCRSHHQKMEKKYQSFYQILLKLRMDFYNTANPDLIKIELQQNGYKIKENTIISEIQLKNGDILKRQNQSEEFGDEDSLKNSLEESENESKQRNNMLGQNYENGLKFNLHY